MGKYYEQATNEAVEATKVLAVHEYIETEAGKTLITKGNWYVKHEDGRVYGVRADEFKRLFATTKNRELKQPKAQ